MIKSTTIYIKEANKAKSEALGVFCAEYRNAVAFYVKYYFSSVFKKKSDYMDPEKLKTPKFYPFNPKITTKLSARALKCAQTQAIGCIAAATKKQQKRVYMIQKLKAQNKCVKNVLRVAQRTTITKPKIPSVMPCELNSIIVKCSESSTARFELAFLFESLFSNSYKKHLKFNNKILILAKKHRHFNSLAKQGKQMTSFLVQKNQIQIRFDIPDAPKQKTGLVIGVDQGAKTCISCASASGDYFSSAKCPHGHDLDSIMKKLSRKQKGSKAFLRAQEHRTNYINSTINKLNLSGVKELRLEKLYDMRRGQRTSRYLSHFPYPLIERKLQDICIQNGVRFVLQSNAYRSQRCSSCGFVHANNRIAKTFKCRACSFSCDADQNAALNHLADLPDLDRSVIGSKNKTTGFYWNPDKS